MSGKLAQRRHLSPSRAGSRAPARVVQPWYMLREPSCSRTRWAGVHPDASRPGVSERIRHDRSAHMPT
eukprot:scaffold6207_cov32-Tisochrysis_lutea.AAC.2